MRTPLLDQITQIDDLRRFYRQTPRAVGVRRRRSFDLISIGPRDGAHLAGAALYHERRVGARAGEVAAARGAWCR